MSTGMIAAASSAGPASAAAAEFDPTGLTKANIPTPALVVDLDAFEANLQKMADHCRQAKVGFRPHAKTHKCPEIARRQIAAGALGICTATVPEAEALAAAGIRGLLLTSPIVDPGKIARVIALAKQGQLMVSVGHPREVALLAEAAAAAKITLDVLVDLDVGDKRTGILPGQPAVELAQIDRGHEALGGPRRASLCGARLAHRRLGGPPASLARSHRQGGRNATCCSCKAGFDAKILSGGSTGTYNIDSAIEGMTELQVGSYVFMDMDYRRIGGRESGPVYTDFQPSLTVLATVVSTTHAERVTVDAGTKAVDTTTAHRPDAKRGPACSTPRMATNSEPSRPKTASRCPPSASGWSSSSRTATRT